MSAKATISVAVKTSIAEESVIKSTAKPLVRIKISYDENRSSGIKLSYLDDIEGVDITMNCKSKSVYGNYFLNNDIDFHIKDVYKMLSAVNIRLLPVNVKVVGGVNTENELKHANYDALWVTKWWENKCDDNCDDDELKAARALLPECPIKKFTVTATGIITHK